MNGFPLFHWLKYYRKRHMCKVDISTTGTERKTWRPPLYRRPAQREFYQGRR